MNNSEERSEFFETATKTWQKFTEGGHNEIYFTNKINIFKRKRIEIENNTKRFYMCLANNYMFREIYDKKP